MQCGQVITNEYFGGAIGYKIKASDPGLGTQGGSEFCGRSGFKGQRSTYVPQGKNWTCGSFGPRGVWTQPWSMPRPGAAMPRSCWPGLRREPASVRAPFTRPQAPGSTHTLPDSDLCCLPPELEFAKSIMKIAEAGKVSIHQQVTMTSPTPIYLHPVSGARPQPGIPGYRDGGPAEKRLLPGEGTLLSIQHSIRSQPPTRKALLTRVPFC